MIETDQQEQLAFILASSKDDQAILLERAMLENPLLADFFKKVIFIQEDPEKLMDEERDLMQFEEPLGSPEEAVMEKLRVVRESLSLSPGEFIFATDVAFKANGIEGHKKNRKGMDRELELIKVIDKYCREGFLAEWEIVFGVMDHKGKTSMGSLLISAYYNKIDIETAEERFLPSSNAGLPLVEIGLGQGVAFNLDARGLSFDKESVINENNLSFEEVSQFVVDKVPNEKMFIELIAGLIGEISFKGVGLVAQAMNAYS